MRRPGKQLEHKLDASSGLRWVELQATTIRAQLRKHTFPLAIVRDVECVTVE